MQAKQLTQSNASTGLGQKWKDLLFATYGEVVSIVVNTNVSLKLKLRVLSEQVISMLFRVIPATAGLMVLYATGRLAVVLGKIILRIVARNAYLAYAWTRTPKSFGVVSQMLTPLESFIRTMPNGEYVIEASNGTRVQIPPELRSWMLAYTINATVKEAAIPGNRLYPATELKKLPGCVVVDKTGAILGHAFRSGDYIYTAKHVLDLGPCATTIHLASPEGVDTRILPFDRQELTIEDLHFDRVRFTSPAIVGSLTKLRLPSYEFKKGNYRQFVTVFTSDGAKWHFSEGQMKHLPDQLYFDHTCSTIAGTSGSPVFQNGKVVGMHLGGRTGMNYAMGFFDFDPEFLALCRDPKPFLEAPEGTVKESDTGSDLSFYDSQRRYVVWAEEDSKTSYLDQGYRNPQEKSDDFERRAMEAGFDPDHMNYDPDDDNQKVRGKSRQGGGKGKNKKTRESGIPSDTLLSDLDVTESDELDFHRAPQPTGAVQMSRTAPQDRTPEITSMVSDFVVNSKLLVETSLVIPQVLDSPETLSTVSQENSHKESSMSEAVDGFTPAKLSRNQKRRLRQKRQDTSQNL